MGQENLLSIVRWMRWHHLPPPPPSHRIRNSSPGGLRSSMLPLCHDFNIDHYEWAGKKHFASLKLEVQSGFWTRDLRLSKQAALTTHQDPRPSNMSPDLMFFLYSESVWIPEIKYCPHILLFKKKENICSNGLMTRDILHIKHNMFLQLVINMLTIYQSTSIIIGVLLYLIHHNAPIGNSLVYQLNYLQLKSALRHLFK